MKTKFWLITDDEFPYRVIETVVDEDGDEPPYSNDSGILQFYLEIEKKEGDEYPTLKVLG